MTETNLAGKTPAVIEVDQFVAAPPAKVWRLLTEPELMRLWWAEGEVAAVVGHQFTLDMPGYGKQPARCSRSIPAPLRLTFTAAWTLAWRLEPEGAGTRVFLEHSGFDPDDKRMAEAFNRMGPGCAIIRRLAEVAARE